MPRLPDVQSLGARPAAAPQQAVIGYDTPSIGEAESMVMPLGGVGDALTRASERMFKTQDALDRARHIEGYEAEAADELRNLESSADLTLDETIAGYGESLSTRMKARLSGHKGSMESRAALEAELLDIRSRYAGEIASKSAVASKHRVTSLVNDTVGSLSARAGQDPSSTNDLFEALDRRVATLADAMSPEEIRAARIGGRGNILMSATESLLNHGDYEAAQDVLAAPEAAQYLSPDDMRRLQERIVTGQQQKSGLASEFAELNTMMMGMYGRPLSEQEFLSRFGMEPPSAGTTVNVQGAAPTPMQGWQNVFDEQGRLVRQEPIPEGPAAREIAAEDAAIEVRRKNEVQKAKTQLKNIDTALARLAEGAGGPLEGSIPNWASPILAPSTFDLQGQVDSVKAILGLDQLTNMRKESAAGASGLGALSQKELEAIQSIAGALDIRNPARLRDNLEALREHVLNVMYGSPEEIEAALDAGTLTPDAAAELQRARASAGFDVTGQPEDRSGTVKPPPSEAARKPIRMMSEQEMAELINDPTRLQTLTDAEYAELKARIRGETAPEAPQ